MTASEFSHAALRFLGLIGHYPSRILLPHPFKIMEFEAVAKLAEIEHGDRVLDVGCGTGALTMLVARRSSSVVGGDISSHSVQTARRSSGFSKNKSNVDFVISDASALPFIPGSFDKVVSYCVLEHIPKWKQALRNMHDCLSCGGTLVISVDSLDLIDDPYLKEKHAREYSVFKYFDRKTLEEALKEAGFDDIVVAQLLTSERSRDLFIKGTEKSFKYNLMATVIEYLLLKINENGEHKQQEKGIFLVARAISK
jgi:SAM-dependent methyltransferase